MNIDPNDLEKLKTLNNLSYEQQAVWFLNATWDEHSDKADDIFRYMQLMAEIDEQEGLKGSKLMQLHAHRFLEKTGHPHTVIELITLLKEKANKKKDDRTISLIEYLFFFFKTDLHRLVNAPQNSNKEEIEKAQKLMDDAQTKLNACLASAQKTEKAEKEQKATEAEVERACNELKQQEDQYNQTTSKLKFKSEDSTKGIVFRNKAKNELQQHLAQDTLGLRKAKINQEAALRKAKVATEKAEKLKEIAVKLLKESEESFRKAEERLDEIKKMGGSGQGTIWMMEKKLHESKKYLPQSKGGISRA